MNQLLTPDSYRFIDQSNLGPNFPAIQSFAIDDALSISVGERKSPTTARLWVHPRTIVLGIADARLPHVHKGIEWLASQGYDVVVRNSGGLAVVLDEGVLNLSLIFPDAKQVDIHQGYEAMVQFIQSLFKEEGEAIEAYEVTGSYCPGSYDLSIGGKKFAGISQRRVKNGSAVQIYLGIEGNGQERASVLQQFYTKSLNGEQTNFSYPVIQPETMASLSQLLNKTLTVADVRNRILYKLHDLASNLETTPLSDQEIETFQKRLQQMVTRNEKALDTLQS